MTTAPTSIAGLAELMYRSSAHWFPEVHDRGDLAIRTNLALGLGGETGEVLDVLKKADICGLVTSCDKHADGKHDHQALADELADLFTYLLNLAHHEGIDLVNAYMAKRQVCVDRWGDVPGAPLSEDPQPCGCGRPVWSEAAEEEAAAEGEEYDPAHWCPHWCIEDVPAGDLRPGDAFAIEGDMPLEVHWFEVTDIDPVGAGKGVTYSYRQVYGGGPVIKTAALPTDPKRVLRCGMVGRQTIAGATS